MKSIVNNGRFAWVILIASFQLLSSCGPVVDSQPSELITCNFPVVNIFMDCHNPYNGTKPVSYTWTLQTFYYSGNTRVPINGGFASNTSATIPSPNFTAQAKIPNDGKTWWDVDITVEATQCTSCAEPSTCVTFLDGNTGTWHGARPVYSRHSAKILTAHQTSQPTAVAVSLGSAYSYNLDCLKCTLQ